MAEMRLQKYIANQGVCSRRHAEELISSGRVSVNGEVVTKLGIKIDSTKDSVSVNGKKISAENSCGKIYIALNKPVDYITSSSDEQGKSVLELLTSENAWSLNKCGDMEERVYPVGRLDKDSEGLVLLTNDGDLTNELTHPRFGHEKEYEVVIDKALSSDASNILKNGMNIGDEWVGGVNISKQFKKGRQVVLTMILQEGKNRQIRKMLGRLGYNVFCLRRIRIGKLKLGTLPIGRWKIVQKSQII